MAGRKNIIVILIIFSLLIGIAFIGVDNNIGTGSEPRTGHALSKAKALSNKYLYLVKEKLKFPGKLTQLKQNNLYRSFGILEGSLFRKLLNINEPIDYRKCIRQAIPHYFNGSNYKQLLFL